MQWYFLIFSYYLTVLNGCSLTALKSIEFTQCSGSFTWGGPSAFGIYMFSLCNGISLYFLIIWPFRMGAHWLHWKAKSSLWSLAVSNGGGGIIVSFPYIFLLFDCFKWALIDCIIKCRLHSMLWQFQMGRGSICLWYLHVCSMHCYFLISSYYLTVSNGHSLTALKSVEVTQHSGSFKWGVCHLYLPIIWLFWMGTHWPYRKV